MDAVRIRIQNSAKELNGVVGSELIEVSVREVFAEEVQ